MDDDIAALVVGDLFCRFSGIRLGIKQGCVALCTLLAHGSFAVTLDYVLVGHIYLPWVL